MADPEHEALIRHSIDEWNQWRSAFAGTPDLSHTTFDELDLTAADLSHTNLQDATFLNCVLVSAKFDTARLQRARFSGRNPATHIDFRGAEMSGVRLTMCDWHDANFYDAHLDGARIVECGFTDCAFAGAHLNGTQWNDCTLNGCNFSEAELAGARFEGDTDSKTTMTLCNLANATLAGADLRCLVGYQFDNNNIQGALIAPRAADDWSVLRRTYTGSRLVFNLILLACFFAPVVAKIVFWDELSRLEAQLPVAMSTVNRLADELQAKSGQVGGEMAQSLRRTMADIPVLRREPGASIPIAWPRLLPLWLAARELADRDTAARLLAAGLEDALAGSAPAQVSRNFMDRLADELAGGPQTDAKAMADALRQATARLPALLPQPRSLLVAVVLGLDVPWSRIGVMNMLGAGAAILLIVYNSARALLTFFVTRLRDEEQVSSQTPRRQWATLWVAISAAEWGRLARPMAFFRSLAATLRRLPPLLVEHYGWMMWPQRVVFILQFLAYATTACNLYGVVSGTVVLPT